MLTYKNLLITFKNPKNIVFIIITPFLLGLFLYAFQRLAADNSSLFIPNPQPQAVSSYQRCKTEGCVSLDIRLVANSSTAGIKDYPWIESVLNDTKASGIDVNVGSEPITNFNELESYYTYVEQQDNKIQAGLILCGDNNYLVDDDINNFCKTSKDHTYYLFLKKINSLGIIFHAINEPFPIDNNIVALKVHYILHRLLLIMLLLSSTPLKGSFQLRLS